MAIAMYLYIKGSPAVNGECQVTGFSNWIDISSYSVGASNPTSAGTGTGSGAGKVSVTSVSFQKSIDTATPSLFLSCCSGNHFDSAQIQVLEAGGNAPVAFLVIDFTSPFVDSISWGAADGGGKPSESFSFSYQSIKFTYTPQNADGSGGTPVPFGWNVQTNVQL